MGSKPTDSIGRFHISKCPNLNLVLKNIFFQEDSFLFERGKKQKMAMKEILDEYLGKQTKAALKELPQIARELNYHFKCYCAVYNRYSDDFSHIIGYILDE